MFCSAADITHSKEDKKLLKGQYISMQETQFSNLTSMGTTANQTDRHQS